MNSRFKFFIIVLFTHSNNCDEVTIKPIFRFSSWDFETILSTTGFLDKSILLQKIFEMEHFLLIVAPRLSGKSTILNMVKKFLEIEVDFSGNLKDTKESSNYQLFVKNKLAIFQNNSLFYHKHFGSYPVIYIDYKPLSAVNSYTSMIKQFREIILNAFEPYEYLVDWSAIWKNEASKNRFKKYCQSYGNFSLTETEIIKSFTFLSKLLFQRFNKSVFVLMDDFDAFVESPYLKDSIDKDKILDFVYTVNYRLFKSNKYIYRGIVLGVIRQNCTRLYVPANKILPDNVLEYNCHNYNCFNEFFGVTQTELDFLTRKFYSRDFIRRKVKKLIVSKSTETERNMQIYSMWSVLRYLANFNVTTESLPLF